MILCCLDCVKFEAVQNSKIVQCLDNVKCRFVTADLMPLVRGTMTKFLSEIVISDRVVRVKRLVLIRDRFINHALQV